MSDDLTCPTCSEPELTEDDMCQHREPTCLACCANGEHHWRDQPPYRDGNEAA